MKKKNKKDITLKQTISNNLYAIKMIWKLSPLRVIFMGIESLMGYGCWVFFSAFFIRYIVNAVENERPFHEITFYIIIVSIVMACITIFSGYIKNVYTPSNNALVYHKLYTLLYKKAENMELACFEDSEFYNRYTMALDNAGEKMLTIVGEVFGIIFSVCTGSVAYATMFSIDKWMVVFVIAPILGNFFFGTMMNKINFRIYREATPNNRRIEYVNRVMYLAEYSKEMRLSNIYQVLKRTYNEAIKENIKIVKRYIGRNMVFGFGQYYFSYTIIFEGVLLYGAYLAIVKKSITLGELSILASIMGTAAWILVMLGQSMSKFVCIYKYLYNRLVT